MKNLQEFVKLLNVLYSNLAFLSKNYFLAKPKIFVPPRFQGVSSYAKGENIVLKIPFKGYPRPTAQWSKDGSNISSSDHYEMEMADRHAILTVHGAIKEDIGNYRLLLENPLGSDS